MEISAPSVEASSVGEESDSSAATSSFKKGNDNEDKDGKQTSWAALFAF